MGETGKGWSRITLGGAGENKLFFAQVREDPMLEIEALEAGPADTVVVVSSGGCTALSLLAAGAGRVVAVDLNTAQNNIVELKAAAVARLAVPDVVAFLGGSPISGPTRRAAYGLLRPDLSAESRRYWDERRRAIERGVLGSGVSERFIGVIVGVMRAAIHPPGRIRRLLTCRTLGEQRALYEQEWDNRRWRLLFKILLNRAVFRHTYHPAFFEHVENPSFGDHFHRLTEHALTNVAVADNYFLHQMLTGSYPHEIAGGVPPYLDGRAAAALAGSAERLLLVDGSYIDHLKTCTDGSIAGFSLSNICEWLDSAQLDQLMSEIVRTSTPGARLVFRNFVGWTEVPPRWREVIVEDRARGEALIARDRSLMQRRFAVCRVLKTGASPDRAAREARQATPDDNEALLKVAAACPMEGDIGLCVERRPDFFSLNRLEGDNWSVGVVDDPDGVPIGCVAVAQRTAYLHGLPTPTMYVSDLKVHPEHRGTGAADALTAYARERCQVAGGDEIPTLLTILAGNRSMERRLSGPRGLPNLHRFATIRSHSVSLLWRRRPPQPQPGRVERGRPDDIEEMAALWQRVAPQRQFAAVHDATSLAAWIEAAPGLDTSCYYLARDPAGRLAGFVGLWDQDSFKQMKVTSYSSKLAVVRSVFNAAAPLVGTPRLPPAGGALRYLTAVHVCVPGSTPGVLRSLLVHAYNDRRGQGYSFMTIGLDVVDPLAGALSGLLAQPTDIWACMATLGGPYKGPDIADRPLHHEIALV